MFTRCQACHTVYPVNAALLARGQGKFRCGKCRKVGNALEALFDQWPDAGQAAPAAGDLPELGAALSLKNTPPAEAGDDSSGTPVQPRRRTLQRVVWVGGGLVLLVIIAIYTSSYFGQPLLEHPRLQPLLIQLGIRQPPPATPFRDLAAIELVSREMKAHPDRPGILLLNATIVNRASQRQAYPAIEITLLDMAGEVMQAGLFQPKDYLSRSAELRSGMAPGAFLSIALELPDPGIPAVGFELQFR